MEEERKFIFKITTNDESIKVTSNIKENNETISNKEILILITELLSYGLNIVFERFSLDNNIDTNILNSKQMQDLSDKLDDKVMNYAGELIHYFINYIFNYKNIIAEKYPQDYKYSLAVYTTRKERKAGETLITFNHGNAKKKDQILGTYYFLEDAAEKLLNSNYSKEKVKEIIDKSLTIINYKLNKYIDEY